ncbi:DNA internalization-related competence protein ComEC/Rec2 [Vibrio maerlii]|uniref:DNA internalization-related competence protein ComEC/Rec2 n=1 Tax=Vibrio maerlii TaxID=2231648 RepID=UPI000E3D63D6|nr:DNA internalization-related competence protein ComEC/Rec2 [Vibrio maerlii]
MTRYLNRWSITVNLLLLLSFPYWVGIPHYLWALLLWAVTCCFIKYRRTFFFRILVPFIIVLIVLIGHANRYQSMSKHLYSAGSDITIKGEVDSFFKQISHGYEVTFVVHQIGDVKLSIFEQPSVRLSSPFPLNLGERWQFRVNMRPVYGLGNEYGFDLERYYGGRGVFAKAKLIPMTAIRISQSDSFRLFLSQGLEEFHGRLANVALIKALSLAERGDIDSNVWNAWRDAGILHLIAISGLHIGMMFVIGVKVGRIFRRLIGVQSLPLLFGVLCAFAYASLAGFAIPTLRALVMCALAVFLVLSRRHLDTFTKLTLTAVLILIVNPLASLQMSFWLSFTAVSFIYLAWHITQHLVLMMSSQKPVLLSSNLRRALISALMFHLVSTLLFSLISMYFFTGFSLSSIIVNAFAVPLFLFVTIPLLFLSIALMLVFPALAEFPLTVTDRSLSLINYIIGLIDGSWIEASQGALVLLLIVLLTVSASKLFAYRYLVFPLLSVGLLALGFDYRVYQWRFDVFDVGHGTALLLEKNHKLVLFDTGAAWGGGSMTQGVLLPNIKQRNLMNLDGVVISHFDNDHAGGLVDLNQDQEYKWFLSSRTRHSEENDVQVRHLRCVQGEQYHWQGLIFDFLWPQQTVERPFNPQSCVVRVTDPRYGSSVLIPGDIDAVSEYLLARSGESISSDILIVPHHGSRTSSTSAFIKAVNPKVAIFTAAKQGRWSLPHPEVLQRYVKYGVEVYITGDDGQVTAYFNNSDWRIVKQRNAEYTPWYRQMLRKGVE